MVKIIHFALGIVGMENHIIRKQVNEVMNTVALNTVKVSNEEEILGTMSVKKSSNAVLFNMCHVIVNYVCHLCLSTSMTTISTKM